MYRCQFKMGLYLLTHFQQMTVWEMWGFSYTALSLQSSVWSSPQNLPLPSLSSSPQGVGPPDSCWVLTWGFYLCMVRCAHACVWCSMHVCARMCVWCSVRVCMCVGGVVCVYVCMCVWCGVHVCLCVYRLASSWGSFQVIWGIWKLLSKDALAQCIPLWAPQTLSSDSFLTLGCEGLIHRRDCWSEVRNLGSLGTTLPLTSCTRPWVSLFPFLALSFLIFKKRRLVDVWLLFPVPHSSCSLPERRFRVGDLDAVKGPTTGLARSWPGWICTLCALQGPGGIYRPVWAGSCPRFILRFSVNLWGTVLQSSPVSASKRKPKWAWAKEAESQREPGRKFPQTQAKCQGKRSLLYVPECQRQSSASCQSLTPTAHMGTIGTLEKARVLTRPPHTSEARPQRPGVPALDQCEGFLESPG